MRTERRYLTFVLQRNIGLLHIRIGGGNWYLRYQHKVPIDTPSAYPVFVRKSTFTLRVIVHPAQEPPYGNTVRLVCEECGAEYPYGSSPTPCAFCAVLKRSGWHVQLGKVNWDWSWS